MGGFLKSMLDSKASKLWLSGLKIFVLFEKQLGDTRLHQILYFVSILDLRSRSTCTSGALRLKGIQTSDNYWRKYIPYMCIKVLRL